MPRVSRHYGVDPDPVRRYLSIHLENSNLHDLKASMRMPYDDFLILIGHCIEQPVDLFNKYVKSCPHFERREITGPSYSDKF